MSLINSGSIEQQRKIISGFWTGLSAVASIIVAGALIFIVGYVVYQGIGSINIPFLTEVPHPIGVPGGGVGNGIVGTLIIVAIAAIIAIPMGFLIGIHISFFGSSKLNEAIRFSSDVLASVPSITIGIFAYVVFVAPFHHFSAFSASFAFAVLMMPIVIRTTESSLQTVPREMREAAMALGANEVQALFRCILVAARPGIMTGVILSIARVTGETAPLLFTAFGSQFWEFNPTKPMGELSLQVFTYAISPYQIWHNQAWGGALVLIFTVLTLSVLSRLLFRRRA
ncbi:phosphate transport system permease protein [Acidiphilium sp. MT5]